MLLPHACACRLVSARISRPRRAGHVCASSTVMIRFNGHNHMLQNCWRSAPLPYSLAKKQITHLLSADQITHATRSWNLVCIFFYHLPMIFFLSIACAMQRNKSVGPILKTKLVAGCIIFVVLYNTGKEIF